MLKPLYYKNRALSLMKPSFTDSQKYLCSDYQYISHATSNFAYLKMNTPQPVILLLKYVCLKRLYIHFISESGQPLLVDTQQDFKFCFDKKRNFARQTFPLFFEKKIAAFQRLV